jgi:O-antigen/teichoic acid export membrane protein
MLKNNTSAVFKNKQFNNLITYGVGQGFNLITPLLVVPYIVYVCGIENFGKTSIGMAICFFLMVFIDYGSDIIGVKDVAVNRENPAQLEKIFITTFSTKFLLLLIVLLIASLLFYFIPFFHAEKELFFLGLPILIGQFINPTWFLQGIENFKWITILTIFSKAIYLLGILFFIQQKSDYIFVNLWWGIGTILANTIAFFFIVQSNAFSFKKIKRENIISLLKNNFSLFSSQIFMSLQMYSPIMLIGVFGTNIMAGQFKIVDQVIVIFKTYIHLFFNFVYPRICFLLEKKRSEGIEFWKKYNGLNFIFIIMAMCFVSLFANEIVSYFTLNNVNDISILLQVATLIPIALAVSIPLKQLLLGSNKQGVYIKTTTVVVILNVLIMIAVLPKFEILGVLCSLVAIEIITILIYYISLKEIFWRK